jgi:hypothetical protein
MRARSSCSAIRMSDRRNADSRSNTSAKYPGGYASRSAWAGASTRESSSADRSPAGDPCRLEIARSVASTTICSVSSR